MKKLSSLLMILAFGAASSLAMAQAPAEPPAGKGDGKHPPRMMDCSKIAEADRKARCESRQKAMKAAQEACKGKEGPEHRKCMREQMPAPGKSK